MEIRLIVKIKEGFVSTNALYNARVTYAGGRARAQVYKNPKAVRVESIIRDQLRAVDFTEYLDWLRNTKQFKILFQFILKSGVKRKDTSNYIKNLEDIWTRFVKEDLGIENYDDSKHLEVHAYKSLIPGLKEEIACIQIIESTANLRFDKIVKPEQVIFHFPKGDLETKDFKKTMKDLELKYEFQDSAKKLKEPNADVFIVSNPGVKDTIDIIDHIYSYKDSRFTYVITDSIELKDRLDAFKSATVRAVDLEDWNNKLMQIFQVT